MLGVPPARLVLADVALGHRVERCRLRFPGALFVPVPDGVDPGRLERVEMLGCQSARLRQADLRERSQPGVAASAVEHVAQHPATRRRVITFRISPPPSRYRPLPTPPLRARVTKP